MEHFLPACALINSLLLRFLLLCFVSVPAVMHGSSSHVSPTLSIDIITLIAGEQSVLVHWFCGVFLYPSRQSSSHHGTRLSFNQNLPNSTKFTLNIHPYYCFLFLYCPSPPTILYFCRYVYVVLQNV